MTVKIIADSTNDLSFELLQKYDIKSIPLTIVMGDKEYRDGIDITPRDIFSFSDSGKGNSHTSAMNIVEYREHYQEALAAGADAIIHFTISSDLSAAYNNALSAAEELHVKGRIFTIDTQTLSTGGGWLVIYAAELAAQGLSAAEIAQKCEQKRQRLSTSFVLDTLEYMRRGGRCSGFSALSAGMLKIKPCLEIRNGKLGVGKKYRGSMKKVIPQYLHDKLEGQTDLDLSRAFITHTFYDDAEIVEEAVSLTKELGGFDEVLVTEAGCSVANHCGPGTLGVLFYRA